MPSVLRAHGLSLSLAASLCAACHEPPAPAAAPAAPAPGRLERLALEDPGGAAQVDERIRELQALLRKQPEKLDGWILLGRAFVQKARQATEPGFYANARACADRALALRPEYPLALDLQGMVLMNEHRFAEALALARGVLAKDPDDLFALGTVADAAVELGDLAGAVAAVDRMTALKPNLPAYARVAHLRWLHGDVAGAKAAYRLAMDAGRGARDPEPLAWVMVEAAKVFLAEGDVPTAQAGFQQAAAAFPGYPPAQVGLGRVALAAGDPAEAARRFEAAFGESALAETAWWWAEALRAAGQDGAAAAAYARAERLGRHGEGRVLAALLGQDGRQLDEARAAAERELAGRGDHLTHDAYALVLLRQGRLPEARAALARALSLGTPEPQVILHDGLLLVAEGRAAEGRARLEEAWRRRAALMPSQVAELEAALGKRKPA